MSYRQQQLTSKDTRIPGVRIVSNSPVCTSKSVSLCESTIGTTLTLGMLIAMTRTRSRIEDKYPVKFFRLHQLSFIFLLFSGQWPIIHQYQSLIHTREINVSDNFFACLFLFPRSCCVGGKPLILFSDAGARLIIPPKDKDLMCSVDDKFLDKSLFLDKNDYKETFGALFVNC